MKNSKKLFITLLLCVVGALCAVLAACGSKTVKFTFDTKGGTEIAAENVVKGEEYTLPVPEYSGYGFDGWYLSEDYSGNPVEKIVPENDTTFYAKWSKLYAINLELDGGSLAQSALYLKEGANVYDFMQDYVPTKSGLKFGAWFDGNNELAKNKRMPAEAITLTAKYKVEYTVELYTEKFDGTGYEKVLDDVKGYEFVGATYEAEYKQNGYREINHENTVSSIVLSATASENVLKLYFDREVYTLTYNTNLPNGAESQITSANVKYGEEVVLPYDYSIDGYCFEGWSTSASGSVEYKVNYVANKLYGSQGNSEPVKFSPERNVTLYAVWSKGYVDMFGGTDSMFLFEDEANAIYLLRGGVFFKGNYNADKSTFIFEREDDEILLEGKIVSNDAFCYYSAAREQSSYILFNYFDGPDSKTVLYFDEYNGVQYSVRNEQGRTDVSSGTYVIEESGEYTITFTNGSLSGQTMTVKLNSVSIGGVSTDVFLIRNDAEYGKVLLRFIDDNRYYPEVYSVTLSGYGTATYNLGSQKTTVYYLIEEDKITALTSSQLVFVARLFDMSGTAAYVLYNENLDGTYTADDGATVTLDGCFTATYEKDGVSFRTTYSVSQYYSVGGSVISFTNGNDEYTYVLSGSALTAINVDVIEYNYMEGTSTYYAPMLVKDGEDYYLYGTYNTLDGSRMFEKVSKGTVTDSAVINGVKVYTATETYENQSLTSVVNANGVVVTNLNQIKKFAFILYENYGTFTTDWKEAVVEDGKDLFSAEYTVTNGAKIVIYGPYAAYVNKGQTTLGTFSIDEDWDVFVLANANGNLYFSANEDGTALVALSSRPYISSNMSDNSMLVQFNGDGTAILAIFGETEDDTIMVLAVYEDTGKTSLSGAPIYRLAVYGDDDENALLEFEYIELYTSSATYFSIFEEELSGEFISEDDGTLTLDGFGFSAQYVLPNGASGNFRYIVAGVEQEEAIVVLVIDNGYRFFDLNLTDKTFTLRGAEFGTNFGQYYVFENRGMNGYVFLFDGYGNAQVVSILGEEAEVIDENATYTVDGNEFTVNYTNGSKTVTVVGVLGTVRISGQTLSAFFTVRESVIQTYVDTQTWAVYTFDEIGNLTVYGKDGNKYTGTYTLVTDELLFIVSADAGIQSLFTYSVQDATVTPVSFSAKAYYTENLEAFMFAKAGYSVYRGTTYYYNYNAQGETVIYYQDYSDANANEYGMVEENLGPLGDTMTREGKTYYYNDGFAVQFNRKEASKNNYPILLSSEAGKKPFETLTFAPNGQDEFTVNGAVVIDGTQYACTVTRAVDDDGKVSLYFQLTNTSYRVDIDVEYKGINSDGNSLSTYEVTALAQVQTLMSEEYVNNVLYYMFGMAESFPDNSGAMTLKIEYDEQGEVVIDGVSVNLIKEYGIEDLNGDAFVLDKVADYEYVQSSQMYIINFVGDDGYNYCLYARVTRNQFFGMYTYTVYALTRFQTFNNGAYEVEVEKVVYSESGIKVGAFYDVSLQKNGTAIEYTEAYIDENTVYYIVREYDEDKKITSTVYYQLAFAVDSQNGALYSGVTVTELQTNTRYAANGKDFVDVVDGLGVKFIVLNNRGYLIATSENGAENGEYTATTKSGKKFSVKITDEDVEITEIAEEAEEDNQ